MPSQQQNKCYLHLLGHSGNIYDVSNQTLSNVSRLSNTRVSFMDELYSSNIEYQQFPKSDFYKVLVLEKTTVKLYLVALYKPEFQIESS